MNKIKKVLLLAFVALYAQAAVASDVEELTGMLHDFLANSGKEAAHERFWADDLVYSSSAGLRFGKADIMSGFDSASEEESDTPPEVVYSGEEVDVRLYGDEVIWTGDDEAGFHTSHRITWVAHNTGHSVYGPPTGRRVVRTGIANCFVGLRDCLSICGISRLFGERTLPFLQS